MSQRKKLYDAIMAANPNVRFSEVTELLEHLGFSRRIVGDHHIFTKAGIEDIIDLQENDGKCKPYQIRQVRKVFRKENVHV